MAEHTLECKKRLLGCCDDKEKATQFKPANCTTCGNRWHVECATKKYKHGGTLPEDLKARCKHHYRTKTTDPEWSWRCPRCHELMYILEKERQLAQVTIVNEKRQASYFWTCTWEGCTKTGKSGPGGLKTHIDRDHKNIKYPCPNCKEICSTDGALKRHQKLVCKGRQYVEATPLATPVLALPAP